MIERKYINPEALPNWSTLFTQVVVVRKHELKFIYVSGQVGVDNQKKLVGSGNLQDQMCQALKNVQEALSCAGALVQDVVKLVIYVVDYKYEHATIIKEELLKVFSEDHLPALSLIGVAALADEKFLIEIDAETVCEV